MKIERYDLSKDVCDTPPTQLAKGFGITYAALVKLCQHLDVPLPDQRYWEGKRVGRIMPTPYRSYAWRGPDSIEVSYSRKPLGPTPPPVTSKELHKQSEACLGGGRWVQPSRYLGKILPVLRLLRTERRHQRLSKDRYGRLRCRGIFVSEGQFDRALLLLDTLLRILKHFGHTTLPLISHHANANGLAVRVGTNVVTVSVEEFTTLQKVAVEPTAERPSGIKRNYLCLGHLIMGASSHYHEPEVSGERWVDAANDRLEDKVYPIAADVLKVAALRTAELERREETRKPRAEESPHASEPPQARETGGGWSQTQQAEEAQGQALEDAAERWTRCQQMRAYLAAYEARLAQEERRGMDTEARRWLTWARGYVESQDPLGRLPTSPAGPVPERP